MFINWSKTYIMFITNKRKELPEFIQVDNQIIQRVKVFKLLGVLIDDKLTFKPFVDQQRLSINRRLYLIKRHYYLPHEVKIKFFKAFIMPCFDYCNSLCIYFNNLLINKLSKMYYFCLKTLFKLNMSNLNLDQTAKALEKFKIQPFQLRTITRILVFINKICSNDHAPAELKTYLQLTTLNNLDHDLRSNNKTVVVKSRIKTRYGDLLLNHTGGTIINEINYLNFYINQKLFNKLLTNNVNKIVTDIFKIMKKFDTSSNLEYYKL